MNGLSSVIDSSAPAPPTLRILRRGGSSPVRVNSDDDASSSSTVRARACVRPSVRGGKKGFSHCGIACVDRRDPGVKRRVSHAAACSRVRPRSNARSRENSRTGVKTLSRGNSRVRESPYVSAFFLLGNVIFLLRCEGTRKSSILAGDQLTTRCIYMPKSISV